MSASSDALAATLTRLALAPPQSLLLEGGTGRERLDRALFWAMSANCPQTLAKRALGEPCAPCGTCAVCRQIAANGNLDLHIYDGRISNRLDEEKPGPIRALNIDNMRELKSLAATAPHGEGKRIAIFQGMTRTREEALNSLLKTLEEPSPFTLFVLLTPQRQQLLPTLVSRSFCLTLPWTDCLTRDEAMRRWEEELANFLGGGRGFLERVAAKGAVDATLAGQILLECQRALVRCLGGKNPGPLDRALAPLAKNGKKTAILSLWLNEAQEMLAATVSPARVLEAFAGRLFVLLRQ